MNLASVFCTATAATVKLNQARISHQREHEFWTLQPPTQALTLKIKLESISHLTRRQAEDILTF